MFICWNAGGLPMEVHLQSHWFYTNLAIVNELQQYSNAFTIVKKHQYTIRCLLHKNVKKLLMGKSL